jgi:hypothetical protein
MKKFFFAERAVVQARLTRNYLCLDPDHLA